MNRLITREHEIIRQARIRLGLSQQQVATLVSIQIRQYQRLEYGESDVQKLGMRAGLSLCIVLGLDPFNLIFGGNPQAVEDLINLTADYSLRPITYHIQAAPTDNEESSK